MSGVEVAVVLAATAGVVWVNWYFFVSGRDAAVAAGAGGVQKATVVVAGGYAPAAVRVRAGAPVRLTFERRETSPCSEEIVLPDFGIRRFLPAHERTEVEFTPERAGTYEFTCGMSMLRGRIVVDGGEG